MFTSSNHKALGWPQWSRIVVYIGFIQWALLMHLCPYVTICLGFFLLHVWIVFECLKLGRSWFFQTEDLVNRPACWFPSSKVTSLNHTCTSACAHSVLVLTCIWDVSLPVHRPHKELYRPLQAHLVEFSFVALAFMNPILLGLLIRAAP